MPVLLQNKLLQIGVEWFERMNYRTSQMQELPGSVPVNTFPAVFV